MEMLCDLSSVIYPKRFILCDFHFQTLKKYFHNSNSRVSWRCTSRRATHQEELRSFSKVQNLWHVLWRWWARVPFCGGLVDAPIESDSGDSNPDGWRFSHSFFSFFFLFFFSLLLCFSCRVTCPTVLLLLMSCNLFLVCTG